MRGKRAKVMRRAARFMSDGWAEYEAVQQRNTHGRAVQPIVVPGKANLPCLVRAGMEIRLTRASGKGVYRRLKYHYKRAKRWGTT